MTDQPQTIQTGMNPEALAALRTVLALIGGWAIGKGWITAEQATQAAGVLVGMAVLGWSVWNARHQKHALADAKASFPLPPVSNEPAPSHLLYVEPMPDYPQPVEPTK